MPFILLSFQNATNPAPCYALVSCQEQRTLRSNRVARSANSPRNGLPHLEGVLIAEDPEEH